MNAGIVDAHVVAKAGKPLPGETAPKTRWDITIPSGETTGTYGAEYAAVVPAGEIKVRASIGYVVSEVTVNVMAGAANPVEVALGVGRLVVHAKAPGGTTYLEGVRWTVTSVTDGKAMYGEGYSTESIYNIAAGQYKVTATLDDAVVESTVSVTAGDVLVHDVVMAGK